MYIHVHTYSNNQSVLGVDNSNVPHILAIIATICEEDALEEDKQVLLRLLSIARHIQVRQTVLIRGLS